MSLKVLRPVKYEEKAAPPEALPAPREIPQDHYPIDLVTALRLAGANNLQIALADERVRQAQARLQAANALWLPSLYVGADYNRHDGTIQDTGGRVLDVSRSSLFLGGGPLLGRGSLNGGNNGPSRLTLGIPLGDVLFARLAERQAAEAAGAARASTFNDTLLQVGLAYLDLLQAQGQVAIARGAVGNARELVRLVESRVKAGKALPADGLRAQTELADRVRQEAQAEEAVRVASAELARLLRLDPAVTLFPADFQPVPVCLVDESVPLPDLVAQGVSSRPEVAQNRALVEATLQRLRQEKWRPFLPAVEVGTSAGGFGGGRNAFFGNFDGRNDFDALLVWELRNLGFGNLALQRERASQLRQAGLTAEQVRDTIVAEVARAYHQVHYRRQQVDAARTQAKAAAEALPLNFKGIQEETLRAIEAQQAVQALASAQGLYLAAILDYNRAQFQLLRAIGQPLDTAVCAP
ncbi:MAG: TolC family protein [Planctomycetes bacterium]|nr:TolC family protein [Planctomycetota bacterium]